jgi:hypothetical protein
MWSYTHPITKCSLIVVPEPISNKQEDADIILKKYIIHLKKYKLNNLISKLI